MSYNYRAGRKRVIDIINDTNEISEVDKIPKDQEFTYENGYYGWVSSIFVDIRKSTELFAENKKSSTAKIIRSFTSEIIEILRDDDNLREIGIRGDCVYAIFATPQKSDVYELADKAFYINTFLDMLNELLQRKNMKTVQAGIGLAANQDLVIKAGRKQSAINSKVWIGKAVTYASKLSNIANSNKNHNKILMTDCFYNNVIEALVKNNSDKDVKSWFTSYYESTVGSFYGCNIVKSNFNSWIIGGMKDE